MKKAILILLSLITLTLASAFCNGFKQGFRDGYCYKKTVCIDPIPPICPIPRYDEYTWSGGYQRGFLVGLSKQR